MAESSRAIQSKRLDLIALTAEHLEATLNGNLTDSEKLLEAEAPEEWKRMQWMMRIRLDQLRSQPDLQPWLVRAISLRATGEWIGYTGFHTGPNPEYLQPIAPDSVEMGYTIFPAFRRKGYATEAVAALMMWAREEHGVQRFVLSIRPDNVPSLRIASHFGFQKVGSHIDEIDGLENILLLDMDAPSAAQTES